MTDVARARQAAAIAQNAKDKADAVQQSVSAPFPCMHVILTTNLATTINRG